MIRRFSPLKRATPKTTWSAADESAAKFHENPARGVFQFLEEFFFCCKSAWPFRIK